MTASCCSLDVYSLASCHLLTALSFSFPLFPPYPRVVIWRLSAKEQGGPPHEKKRLADIPKLPVHCTLEFSSTQNFIAVAVSSE